MLAAASMAIVQDAMPRRMLRPDGTKHGTQGFQQSSYNCVQRRFPYRLFSASGGPLRRIGFIVMKARKSFPLRIDPRLFEELEAWAQQDLRSVNGQIEFILSQAVQKHRGVRDWNAPAPSRSPAPPHPPHPPPSPLSQSPPEG